MVSKTAKQPIAGYRDFLEYAFYPMALIDQDHKIVTINQQFQRCFGYNEAEIVHVEVENLVPEISIDPRHNFEIDFNNEAGNRILGRQNDLIAYRKDGSTFPVEVGISYITTDGESEILATIIDVSQRKQIEKSMSKYIERLDLSLSGGNIGVWDWDLKNDILFWDDSLYRLYGIDKSKFDNASDAWSACIHPEDKIQTEAAVSKVLQGNISFDMEYRIITQSNDIKHIHGKANIVRDESDAPIRLVGVSYDITAKKEAFNKLFQSESKLKAFFDTAPVGIARNSMDGKFKAMNPEFERFTGYTKEELNELSYWHLTPEEYQKQEEIQLKSLNETGKYGPYKKEYIHKDGHRYPVLLHGQILKDIEGNDYIWSTVQDLSNIEDAQKKLLDSLEQLTVSNDELKRFAYVASHDLQEPLRVIMSYLQLVEMSSKELLDEKSKDYIQRSFKAAKRMRTLIEDLLSFSRVDNKHIKFVPIFLNDIVDIVLDDLSLTIKQSNATINLPDVLPTVLGDPGQLQRVFLNIFGNALKYQPKNSKPVIDVTVKETKKDFEISIQDNGIGIEKQHHGRVFEVFQRLHTRDEYSGTGIGLSIVKKIIKQHNGKVWFDSKFNEGSTFTFALPKKQRNE
jgi:PAS domain S-box-containing protein